MDLAWCLVCLGYVTQQTHVPLAWRPRHSSHLQEARAPSLPFPFSSSLAKLFSSDKVQRETDGIVLGFKRRWAVWLSFKQLFSLGCLCFEYLPWLALSLALIRN